MSFWVYRDDGGDKNKNIKYLRYDEHYSQCFKYVLPLNSHKDNIK